MVEHLKHKSEGLLKLVSRNLFVGNQANPNEMEAFGQGIKEIGVYEIIKKEHLAGFSNDIPDHYTIGNHLVKKINVLLTDIEKTSLTDP